MVVDLFAVFLVAFCSLVTIGLLLLSLEAVLVCCGYACVVSVGLLAVYWCCCIVWFGVLLVVVGAWF